MTEKQKEKEGARFSSFHLECDRCSQGMRMFVSGIVGIGEYSEESILLKSHGCRMMIQGKKMKICVYENNTVEVVGKILVMEFLYGKN